MSKYHDTTSDLHPPSLGNRDPMPVACACASLLDELKNTEGMIIAPLAQ